MSVSQAQHKLGTTGEINSINFLGGPAGLYDMFTKQKIKALFPRLPASAQYYGAVIAKSGAKHVA